MFPHLYLVVFIAGYITCYRCGRFSWTAKSSELIERKRLIWGSLPFRLGIIPVFFRHIVGLLIPKSWMDTTGVLEHLYHIDAVYTESTFGIITLVGTLLLTVRRVTAKSIRRLGLASDILVNLLLLLIVFMGCYIALIANIQHPDFNHRTSLSVWFRQLSILKPDASLASGVSVAPRIHILLGLIIMACWSFTRLVHVWSVSLTYINRRYIIYYKNKV